MPVAGMLARGASAGKSICERRHLTAEVAEMLWPITSVQVGRGMRARAGRSGTPMDLRNWMLQNGVEKPIPKDFFGAECGDGAYESV